MEVHRKSGTVTIKRTETKTIIEINKLETRILLIALMKMIFQLQLSKITKTKKLKILILIYKPNNSSNRKKIKLKNQKKSFMRKNKLKRLKRFRKRKLVLFRLLLIQRVQKDLKRFHIKPLKSLSKAKKVIKNHRMNNN